MGQRKAAIQRAADNASLNLGLQDVVDGVRVELGEDGDGHRAHRGDCEVGDAPVRHILAEQGDPVAVGDPLGGQVLAQHADLLAERVIGDRVAVDPAEAGVLRVVLDAVLEQRLDRQLAQSFHAGSPFLLCAHYDQNPPLTARVAAIGVNGYGYR